MQSLFELHDYLMRKLDYDTFVKEAKPLLEKLLKEHFNALENQLERIRMSFKS